MNVSRQWCRRLGCRGCKRTPKSFDLLKIQAKSLKIWAKSLKIWAKSLKIWAKTAPDVCRKTSEDHFLGGHTKKTVSKSCTTIFWASLGKFGQKSFASPKLCLLLHVCIQIPNGFKRFVYFSQIDLRFFSAEEVIAFTFTDHFLQIIPRRNILVSVTEKNATKQLNF